VKDEPVSEGNPLDFLFVTKSLKIGTAEFSFRELSVQESDACLDKSKRPDGSIDGRMNMRLLISKSSVEPKITLDVIAAMPNRIYIKFAEFVNELNSIDDAEEAETTEEGEAKNA